MTPTITPETPTLSDIIASMRNYAGVAEDCEVTQGHAPVAIRNWIEMLEALSELQAAPAAAGVPELFVQWLEREMPPGTIIGKPAWWAPKLARALRSAERGVLGGCNG
ncbi:hypothetical protein ACCP99_08050 [Xanthomonas sp. NCPPB 3443]|uniref:hypothetical protein n=1 Tax=Xanthomonas TaxID=338 RepID=UPI0007ED8E8F|nr:hypothetical protein [Xanthomonas arboricola]OBR79105.1 hypothetical protein A7D35_01285 [Xanthomonas arboricola]